MVPEHEDMVAVVRRVNEKDHQENRPVQVAEQHDAENHLVGEHGDEHDDGHVVRRQPHAGEPLLVGKPPNEETSHEEHLQRHALDPLDPAQQESEEHQEHHDDQDPGALGPPEPLAQARLLAQQPRHAEPERRQHEHDGESTDIEGAGEGEDPERNLKRQARGGARQRVCRDAPSDVACGQRPPAIDATKPTRVKHHVRDAQGAEEEPRGQGVQVEDALALPTHVWACEGHEVHGGHRGARQDQDDEEPAERSLRAALELFQVGMGEALPLQQVIPD
mmetsp:Transcript_96372/g.272483  ORF Transcript_96372/g.272483 Transcript_96372/m.272483 type:complete len:277 (+) Transcript_96372:641-1471(+)